MDGPLISAGVLGLLAAAVHGAGGEVLVVRNLSRDNLPPSRFGGPRMTMAMIHVSWHIGTVAFLVMGAALLLSGSVLGGDGAHSLALAAAAAFTGFAVIAGVLGAAYMRSPRSLLIHPGPAVLTATAALAWWGAS